MNQSVLNIGTLGHIDHGKTSLTRAITNVWTDRHSESIKRNMTIKLGYADAIIYKCPKCEGQQMYTSSKKCPNCKSETQPIMRISLLDSPGHETLMATAIAGSSIIDAILFVIAANEPCPMQQTKEHLMIINILGIKNVIIVQTKIDIVGKEAALLHEKQIREFVKGSVIENAPIVPVMTNKGINVDVILKMISSMELPKRDLKASPLMYIVRSFDVNKPGDDATKIKGGVLGGSIIRGVFNQGDKIVIKPGIKQGSKSKRETYEAIKTSIIDMSSGSEKLSSAQPGGLIGVSTEIDPSFAKADGLVGNVLGIEGMMPESVGRISIKYVKLNRSDIAVQSMAENEMMVLGIGTATLLGYVRKVKRDTIEFELNKPVCTEKGAKVAVMRTISKRWKLTGYGIVV